MGDVHVVVEGGGCESRGGDGDGEGDPVEEKLEIGESRVRREGVSRDGDDVGARLAVRVAGEGEGDVVGTDGEGLRVGEGVESASASARGGGGRRDGEWRDRPRWCSRGTPGTCRATRRRCTTGRRGRRRGRGSRRRRRTRARRAAAGTPPRTNNTTPRALASSSARPDRDASQRGRGGSASNRRFARAPARATPGAGKRGRDAPVRLPVARRRARRQLRHHRRALNGFWRSEGSMARGTPMAGREASARFRMGASHGNQKRVSTVYRP